VLLPVLHPALLLFSHTSAIVGNGRGPATDIGLCIPQHSTQQHACPPARRASPWSAVFRRGPPCLCHHSVLSAQPLHARAALRCNCAVPSGAVHLRHGYRAADAQASPVADLVLAAFAPEGSGVIMREWALSPHSLLCSFLSCRHINHWSSAFPLPGHLP
jgi:hypothetical protein